MPVSKKDNVDTSSSHAIYDNLDFAELIEEPDGPAVSFPYFFGKLPPEFADPEPDGIPGGETASTLDGFKAAYGFAPLERRDGEVEEDGSATAEVFIADGTSNTTEV